MALTGSTSFLTGGKILAIRRPGATRLRSCALRGAGSPQAVTKVTPVVDRQDSAIADQRRFPDGFESCVGVILVNYAVAPQILRTTVAALLGSGRVVGEIVVVDNASPRLRDAARSAVTELDPQHRIVRWIDEPRNLGFAGGVNAGLRALRCQSRFVFLCNPDAVVEPDAIALCVDTLLAAPESYVAVAPKMLLSGHGLDEQVIDSVGNAVNNRGEAFNIGLGQPDIGQYDDSTPVFGPCFGAGLFRRESFGTTSVGLLDEDLFLYYEDVDWNWRAQLLGYTAITQPKAIVHHSMSITMRDRPYDDKFSLTERNLILCTLKNFELRHAIRVATRRSLGLLKGSMTGRHYPMPGFRALGGVLRQLPRTLRKRRTLQRRRVRTDQEIMSFSVGEQTFFDAVRYQPVEREHAREFAQQRLQRRTQTTEPPNPPG